MRAGIEPRTARWMAIRIGIVAFAFAAGFVVVAARAVQLQVLQGDRLGGMARDQYLRELTQKPRRGTITDRDGAVLAGNAEADSIFVDPRTFPAGPRTRDLVRLAKALQLDPKALEKKVAKGARFAWVKRRVSPAEAEQVRAMKLAGVGFVKETRRYYPRRELAGQILGIVGDDGEGLEGVEKAWDDSLQGEAMRLPSLRDARGAHLLGAGPAPERVLEGARVELTIEQGLQNAAERALVQAVQQARAASGMAVAIDPATGEILALATAPLLNPNAPRKEDLRNRAVLDTFEVGSTAKAIVLARALDEGAITPDHADLLRERALDRGQARHPRPQGARLGPAGAGDGGELQHRRGQGGREARTGAAAAGLPGLRLRRADPDRDPRRAPRPDPLPQGRDLARQHELRPGAHRDPAPDHPRHGGHRQPRRPHEALDRPARRRPGLGRRPLRGGPHPGPAGDLGRDRRAGLPLARGGGRRRRRHRQEGPAPGLAGGREDRHRPEGRRRHRRLLGRQALLLLRGLRPGRRAPGGHRGLHRRAEGRGLRRGRGRPGVPRADRARAQGAWGPHHRRRAGGRSPPLPRPPVDAAPDRDEGPTLPSVEFPPAGPPRTRARWPSPSSRDSRPGPPCAGSSRPTWPGTSGEAAG